MPRQSDSNEKREIVEINAVGVPTRKRLGEAVEAAFLAKAAMLDFAVSKPWGDSRAYDFVVDSGHRLWRVQVKCATSHRGTRCDARAAGSGPLYTKDDIDFLVAYVIVKNLWYVVPVRHLLRERRSTSTTGSGARECLRYIERHGVCWPVGRRHVAEETSPSDAGARSYQCGAWCVRGSDRGSHHPMSRKNGETLRLSSGQAMGYPAA